jgi:RNA polymerase sigma factor (sigma-70 family)
MNSSSEPWTENSEEPRSETVARHGAGLRALARTLLGDEGADDAVQDTWLRYLEARPQARGSLRGWLATALRRRASNLRRSAARRRTHEADAACDERIDTEGLREREELLRSVTAAVLSLDEPYRAVVMLRWFEDLAPRDVAARLGVDPTVVHTRLSRAHAMLRRRLAHGHGDEHWRAMLALLVRPEATELGATAAAVGVSLMSAKAVLAAVAAALVVGVSLWRAFAVREGPLGDPTAVAETFESAPASGETAHTQSGEIESDVAPQREPVDAKAASSPSTDSSAWPAPAFEYTLEVSVSDALDRPASVGLLAAPAGHSLNRVATTDGNGRAQVRWLAFVAQMEPDLAIEGEAELRRVQLVAGGQRIALRSRAVSSLLTSTVGDASAVTLQIQGNFTERLSSLRELGGRAAEVDALRDNEGRVLFVEPARIEGEGALELEETTRRLAHKLLAAGVENRMRSVVRDAKKVAGSPPDLTTVRGRVTNADGSPAANVPVALRTKNASVWTVGTSDSNGAYELRAIAEGDALLAIGGGDRARLSANVTCSAGALCVFDAELTRGLELRGKLVDSAGEPLNGWRVEIEAVDGELADATVSDERGGFAIPNLPSGALKVLVAPTHGAAHAPALMVSERAHAGENEVVFTAAASANEPFGALRVRAPNVGTAREIESARAWRLDSWRGVAGDVIPPENSDSLAGQAPSIEFSRLTAGAYRIEALVGGGEPFVLDNVWVRPSDRLELDVPPAPASGELRFEIENHGHLDLELTRRGPSVELHQRVRVEGPCTLRASAADWRIVAHGLGFERVSHVAVLADESTTVRF